MAATVAAATVAATPAGSRLVSFPSLGAELRGFLFEHGAERRPTLVMTHGLSATITGMTADRYAAVIHAAGLNVLLFDHRGFGLSGGEPRQQINRWTQLWGYRDALDFATTLPTVDPGRLAVWGDSYGGPVALGVAAFDERVRAAVVQVPACGSDPPRADPDGEAFRYLREVYATGLPAGVETRVSEPTAVVSADQLTAPSILTPITAFRWFIDYGGRPGTGWQNWATGGLPQLPVTFEAGLVAPHLRGASLWCIAGDDEMPGAEPAVSRAVFDSAPEPKELLEVEGGHFGLLYEPSDLFDRVSAAQADFLARYLR